MSEIIGIICLCASLYYGMTAAKQKSKFAVVTRACSAILFLISAYIWLF
jgi:hypothetical protein